MKRLLLIALLSAACATTQQVKDDARVDEESDSVSAKREKGATSEEGRVDGGQEGRSSSGIFKPMSNNMKAAAEEAARQAKAMREAQEQCETEIPDTLTDVQLVELAKEREAQFVKYTGPRLDNAAANKELTRIGLSVSKGVPGVSFGLTTSELTRAFATSTGTVLLTTGLLKKCANEAQLAAVLAHEVEHVRTRADEAPHVKSLRAQCQAAKVMKDLMPNFMPSQGMGGFGSMLGAMENMLRGGDAEADVAALKAIAAAGYEPVEYEVYVRALGDTDEAGVTWQGGAERRAARLLKERETLQLKTGKKPALPKALLAL